MNLIDVLKTLMVSREEWSQRITDVDNMMTQLYGAEEAASVMVLQALPEGDVLGILTDKVITNYRAGVEVTARAIWEALEPTSIKHIIEKQLGHKVTVMGMAEVQGDSIKFPAGTPVDLINAVIGEKLF